jgi:hypothetical protein
MNYTTQESTPEALTLANLQGLHTAIKPVQHIGTHLSIWLVQHQE